MTFLLGFLLASALWLTVFWYLGRQYVKSQPAPDEWEPWVSSPVKTGTFESRGLPYSE